MLNLFVYVSTNVYRFFDIYITQHDKGNESKRKKAAIGVAESGLIGFSKVWDSLEQAGALILNTAAGT